MNNHLMNNIKKAQLTPRCGAKAKSTGLPCLAPAMRNGRCRLHGGKSTGPKTDEGIRNIQKANTKHGLYSRNVKGSLRRYHQEFLKKDNMIPMMNNLPSRVMIPLGHCVAHDMDNITRDLSSLQYLLDHASEFSDRFRTAITRWILRVLDMDDNDLVDLVIRQLKQMNNENRNK